MPGLTTPLWLLGGLALGIPILLHLWSTRARRIIHVGTVRHLEQLSTARAASRRLMDPLLLLLRMMVLVPLILLLAGLVLPASKRTSTVIVLIDPIVLHDELGRIDPIVDSIRRTGTPAYLLTNDFTAVRWGTPSLIPDLPDPIDPWTHLLQASQHFPSATTFLVIAPREFSARKGPRPLLSTPVTWHAPTLSRPGMRIQAAWMGQGDSVVLDRITTSPEGMSSRSLVTVAAPPITQPVTRSGVRLTQERDGLFVTPLTVPGERSAPSMIVRPLPPYTVLIVADPDREAEVGYLGAALTAVEHTTHLSFSTEVSYDSRRVTRPIDAGSPAWVFWLARTPPPASIDSLVQRGAQLFLSDPQIGVDLPGSGTTITPSASGLWGQLDLGSARLWKRVSPDTASTAVVVLTDARGQPLLTREVLGAGVKYRFFSRLDPTWNSLVLDRGLPELLWAVMLPADLAETRFAIPPTTPLATSQLVLFDLPSAADTTLVPPKRSLRLPLLLITIALFGTERLVMARRARGRTR